MVRAGLLVAAACLLLCASPARCQPCVPGVDTPGVTIPRGDIILEHGKILEIYCIINTSHRLSKGRNASHLRFYRNQKLLGKENVKILNTTTAKLTEALGPSKSTYVCKLERKPLKELLVCANMVIVGYRPKPIYNFICTSENWSNLNCSWKERENPIATTYKLSFHLPGRSGGRNQFVCPGNTERFHYCLWNGTTTPRYRTEYEFYYFQFTGTNVLGETVFPKILFHHYGHVVPSKPYRLTYQNVTTNSVYLDWDLDHRLKHFPPGFSYKLQYKALCDPTEEWKTANTSALSKKMFSFALTDLEYANAVYEVRLFIQSRVAAVKEIWSQPAVTSFKTKPDVPKFPPRTQEGSFQVFKKQNHRDLIVYWQKISKCAENGEGFNYRIISVEENGERKTIKPEYTGMSYAHFKKLTFKSYRFEIISENNIGYSRDKSVLFVPSENERPPEPTGVTKYVTEEGTTHISWNPVSDTMWSNKIQSYTIFWCQNQHEESNHCSGQLYWTYSHRNNSQTELAFVQGKINDFAISSNYYSGSSGMVWVTCNLQTKDELFKVATFHVSARSSTSIEVRFHIDCAKNLQENVFYNIFYCPVAVSTDSMCEAPLNKTVQSNTGEIITVVTELLPHTTYLIYIIPVAIKDGEISKYGEASDRIYCKTFESAPSLPQNISLCDVTNQSLVVRWKPPQHLNGILQHYIIHYNGKSLTTAPAKHLEVKLENLKSFTQYEVSMSACTIICSNFTIPVNITTDVGAPGAVNKISARMKMSSEIEVKWEPPKFKGGHLDYYELKVISLNTWNSSTIQHFNSSNLQYIIPVPDCHHVSFSYSFAIRAVNKNESNYTFYGPWSETKEIFCKAITTKSSITEKTQGVHMAVWVVVAVSLGLVLFVIFTQIQRCIAWLNSAQKIEVKLPPGLAPCYDENKVGHTDVTWLLKVNDLRMTQNTQPVADNELDRDWPENHSGHRDGQLYVAMGRDMPANCGTEMEQMVTVSQVLVASVSVEEVSVLGYYRTDNIRSDDISANISVTSNIHSLPVNKDNVSDQSEWSLSDCIVRENVSVGDMYSDSYCLNDLKELQQKKVEHSYVGYTCKPQASLSFSDLSSLSSVSYNLPEHSPQLKDFINRQNSLVSLSNQRSCSESELFNSVEQVTQVEKDVSEESQKISVENINSENYCLQSLEQTQQQNHENNFMGLISRPDTSMSFSDLSSLSSTSFLKNFINSGNSEDSLTGQSLNSECELFSDVIQEEKVEQVIKEERGKEMFVKTRSKLNSSESRLTAVKHVPDSYCRIGVYSTTSNVQDKCEMVQQIEHQALQPVDLKCEAKSINVQTKPEFSDKCSNEDVCSVLSDFGSLEYLTEWAKRE
ncbi:cytokine receptor-like isoform X2 [Schistocerca nitens]|uniref:cytokine receptor-like isoform X2 n=1 Tax=Schistocerca nitens TaxID=7011 RepID=UPI0021185399|nr:cytokine receptor-like isoform X2 [Schistocerca nitens]